MRLLLHGFGSFPIVFYHVIQHARSIRADIEFAIVLSSDHHRTRFSELLGKERVLVLQKLDIEPTACGKEDHYPGYLYRDIEAEKRTFKFAPAATQYAAAMGMYRQMRLFIAAFRPTHALVSQVEGFDGKVFIAAAREANAEVAVPTSCRNLGGIFFSPDDLETLPGYATADDQTHRTVADGFIRSFRSSPKPARWSWDCGNDELLDNFVKRLPNRAWDAVRRWCRTPGGFEVDHLRASLLNNLPLIRDTIWQAKLRWNERYFDIGKVEDLPKKFIYYPLQYSPESSINTPAPYFLDQFRAIDAIRFGMPSDCRLVVKEHPACIPLRGPGFIKRLQHTAGVVVAHYAIPSIELVRRAGLTISVTGTATLEALLFGRAAITLGSSLASSFLGGVCGIEALPARIAAELGRSVPHDTVIAAVATLFSVRSEVGFASPGAPGEPVLRRRNIERFTKAMLEHFRRSAAPDGRVDQ